MNGGVKCGVSAGKTVRFCSGWVLGPCAVPPVPTPLQDRTGVLSPGRMALWPRMRLLGGTPSLLRHTATAFPSRHWVGVLREYAGRYLGGGGLWMWDRSSGPRQSKGLYHTAPRFAPNTPSHGHALALSDLVSGSPPTGGGGQGLF